MEYSVTAKTRFDAGHKIEKIERCQNLHGHSYKITAKTKSKLDVEVAEERYVELSKSLEAIRRELWGRSLNVMMPPADPTVYGVASFIWQRLVMEHPDLVEVTVSESGGPRVTVVR